MLSSVPGKVWAQVFPPGNLGPFPALKEPDKDLSPLSEQDSSSGQHGPRMCQEDTPSAARPSANPTPEDMRSSEMRGAWALPEDPGWRVPRRCRCDSDVLGEEGPGSGDPDLGVGRGHLHLQS